MAIEMGKPLKSGIAEIEKCAWVCEYYADHAHKYLHSHLIKTEMQKSLVVYQPMGILFAIMPWNFPFWQALRFAAPNLMAGNAALLKHAPITTGCGLEIETLFLDAGFPENLFSTLVIDTDLASHVIHHLKVVGVSLTGSIQAGKTVGAQAAKALKKHVLELGGNDPYLILKDADLTLAAEAVVTSRMNNSGQVCIAAKRIIVDNSIKEAFIEKVMQTLQPYQIGDPLDENTNMGPLARQDLRDQVHHQVQETIARGAECILGGVVPGHPGFYYPPTILINVPADSPAYQEEIFGPVLSFINAENDEDAIKIANDSNYGLAGAVFTRNIEKGEQIATTRIQVGSCAVNTFVSSDPRLPFGGIKNSGYGRELGEEGIREFVNIKTVSVK
jgi:succinate-semialdehyde dehydrogenase/glutarate-semialdehyde dehydrogenase